MIICTLCTLRAFNSKGRIITVPEGTYISLPPSKSRLLIELGLAKRAELIGLDHSCHCVHGYQTNPYEHRRFIKWQGEL